MFTPGFTPGSAPETSSGSEADVDEPVPVVLDVDTGVDDAMALLLAVRSPLLDLRAVTCVAGNAAVDRVVANTLYVLDVAGAGAVPVARGATGPLLARPASSDEFHGSDGLGGFSRPSDRRVAEGAAVDLLRHTLLASIGNGERLTLVPLGPQTNIALLLTVHPEVAAGIERIVFMGGSAGAGNVTATAEFNVWSDPEAAAMTLLAARELDIPITMYGLDVFESVPVSAAQAAGLRRHPDPAAQLAGALLAQRAAAYGADEAAIGDAGAVCAVADPGGIVTRRWPVRVELTGSSRGTTVVDRRLRGEQRDEATGVGAATTVVDVAVDVDAGRFADLWLRAVSR